MTLQSFQASLRLCEINPVDLKADESLHAAALGRDCGIPDAEKRIEHGFDARDAVQFDAPFSELNRKRRRMRPLVLAALNRLVGNKPGVPATAKIAPTSVRPSRDVTFVLIWNAECKPINFHSPRLRKVKDVLVTIVKKPLRIDWLEMTVRLQITVSIFNGDRFDPVNGILHKKSA